MSSCDTCSCADKTNCPKKGSSYGFDVVTENSYYETAEIMEGGETGGKCNCGPNCSCTTCGCGH
ncbi:Metallothionein, Plant type 3 [Zostera marina]|uniref:Metallothionein, Plant type 3 n=1 Tax=Zostera marina TaxID=29655 RepID=A0A0K9PWL6_ZOSMR|nr:Metallothionein, Plant type 3 [Zostera marina]